MGRVALRVIGDRLIAHLGEQIFPNRVAVSIRHTVFRFDVAVAVVGHRIDDCAVPVRSAADLTHRWRWF